MSPLQSVIRCIAGFGYSLVFFAGVLIQTGSGLRAQTMPSNLDFANGNFSNWLCYTAVSDTGAAATGTTYKNAVFSGPVAGPPSCHALTSETGIDPVGQLQAVAPGGGTHSMRIGNHSSTGAIPEAEFVRYYLHVPAGSAKYSLLYQCAVVLEDGGHAAKAQPTFHVIAIDSASGAVIPSANNIYLNASLPGLAPYSKNGTGSVYWHSWVPSTLNLSGYGGRTVILEVMASDCAHSGHWAYGYFDVTAVVDYLAPAISKCNLQAGTMQVEGPPGYKYYQWYNQNFSSALNPPSDTSRILALPLPATPQYYNLVLFPYASTGTPDTIRTNVLSRFSINATGSPATIAPGQTVYLNAAIVGGSGNYLYQWAGDTTLSSSTSFNPSANPQTSTQFVVTVTDTNGCQLRDTVQINVSTLSTGPEFANSRSGNQAFTVANVLTEGASVNGRYRVVRIEPGCRLLSFASTIPGVRNCLKQPMRQMAGTVHSMAPRSQPVYMYMSWRVRATANQCLRKAG